MTDPAVGAFKYPCTPNSRHRQDNVKCSSKLYIYRRHSAYVNNTFYLFLKNLGRASMRAVPAPRKIAVALNGGAAAGARLAQVQFVAFSGVR